MRRRRTAGWLIEGGGWSRQLGMRAVARLVAAHGLAPGSPCQTPEGVVAACRSRLQAAAFLVLRPGARPDEAELRATGRLFDRVLAAAAAREPAARFIACVGHRRNGPLVAGLVHGLIAPQAVTLSRERRRQVMAKTLRTWGRARFPQLLKTADRVRTQRPWSPPPRRALPTWHPPPPPPVPVLPDGAWSGSAPPWGLIACEATFGGPTWQELLASVRPLEPRRREQEP